MNKIQTFLAVIAIIAITLSCEKIEPIPQFVKSEAEITLTASVDAVSIPAKDSLTDVVSFTWNDPEYSVGLERSKFILKLATSGTDFVDFMSKEFSGVLESSMSGKELNGMALRLGGVIGQPITLDVMVEASHLNNNETIVSNVLNITVTPYEDLALVASTTSVVCTAATASEEGVAFTWNQAFSGFDGVKTYQFQYAEAGTDFASPTVIDVSSFEYAFNQFDLNVIALSNGISGESTGPIEFRIKATNELGTVLYSNVVSVSITTSVVPYNSIGIIGDATPGGWGVDTDLHRPDANSTNWVTTLYLEGGKEAKFRDEDSWDTNWGSGDFPAGTATQGGSNIPVSSSGYYKVEFNSGTGEYNFTLQTPGVYTNVSLIGAQTNWATDIADLTKDPSNDYVWTGTVTLDAGELKFRADNDWGTNWGISSGTTSTSLSGYTEQDGSNMEIATAGEYFVYINVATGEYFFGKSNRNIPYLDIGIIGDSTPGGWSDDTNLINNPVNPYKWSGTVTLVNGEAKFRADNDWAVNWGDTSFPDGVGTDGGPNIPVTEDTYFITFNTSTGEYTFIK